jgi:hypothetical protein
MQTNGIDVTNNTSRQQIPPAEQDLDLGRDFVSTMNGHEADLGESRAFQ